MATTVYEREIGIDGIYIIGFVFSSILALRPTREKKLENKSKFHETAID